MDKSEAIEIVEMLRTLIHNLDIRPIWESSHIENVKPSSTAFALSKAINAIEWLDGELEDCEDAAEEDEELISYWKESYMEAKDELATLREKYNKLKFDEELAKKIIKQTLYERDIWREKARINALDRDKNSDSATYWKCRCHKLEKAINDREMRKLMREKSDQEACKACDREDCSNCTLCPF